MKPGRIHSGEASGCAQELLGELIGFDDEPTRSGLLGFTGAAAVF